MTEYKLGKSREVHKDYIDNWRYYLDVDIEDLEVDSSFDSLEKLAKEAAIILVENNYDIENVDIDKTRGVASQYTKDFYYQLGDITDDEMSLFLQSFQRSYNDLMKMQHGVSNKIAGWRR